MRTNQQTEQYQPLPHNLTIKKSPIHGLGIFATEDIEKDESLGITHVFNRSFQHSWIRTPLGGLYNHSDTPNCTLIDGYLGEEFVSIKTLRTLKDISSGDEITCTYTLYSI